MQIGRHDSVLARDMGPASHLLGLEKLAHGTEAWHALYRDLDHVQVLIAKLASSGFSVSGLNGLVAVTMRHLREETSELSARTIETEIGALREKVLAWSEYVRISHVLRPTVRFAETVENQSPEIAAQLKALLEAERAAPGASESATKAEVSKLSEALERKGLALGEALSKLPLAQNPLDSLHEAYADLYERAERVKPMSYEQLELKREIISLAIPAGRASVYITKALRCSKLLNPVQDGRPETLKPGEREYFRELNNCTRPLNSFLHAKGRRARTLEERTAASELRLKLLDLPGVIRLPSADGLNYEAALPDLRVLKHSADEYFSARANSISRQIDDISKIVEPMARSTAAIDLIRNEATPMELERLPAAKQLELQRALRGGFKKLDEGPKDFQSAQAKLYAAMTLDPAFRQRDKDVRKRTIALLMHGANNDLIRARNNWHVMSPEEKRTLLERVASCHAAAGGFRPPNEVVLMPEHGTEAVAAWAHVERSLRINPGSRTFDDFEATIDSVFHENSHNWQCELANMVAVQRLSEDPLSTQAAIFQANLDFYVGTAEDYDDASYRAQPTEAHAFMAGAKFTRDLMKALAQRP